MKNKKIVLFCKKYQREGRSAATFEPECMRQWNVVRDLQDACSASRHWRRGEADKVSASKRSSRDSPCQMVRLDSVTCDVLTANNNSLVTTHGQVSSTD